jgi:hypothetical protein
MKELMPMEYFISMIDNNDIGVSHNNSKILESIQKKNNNNSMSESRSTFNNQ